jgi:Ca2+-binding EF-hand superfamily protein
MASADEIFSQIEQSKVKALFDRVDSNHDGKLTADELIKLCAEFGHEMAPERAAEIISKHSDGSNAIDWEHFCKALAAVLVKIKGAVVLVSMYRAMDKDGSGHITEGDLKKLAADAGLDVPQEKIAEFVSSCPKGADGKIAVRDFAKALVQHLRNR